MGGTPLAFGVDCSSPGLNHASKQLPLLETDITTLCSDTRAASSALLKVFASASRYALTTWAHDKHGEFQKAEQSPLPTGISSTSSNQPRFCRSGGRTTPVTLDCTLKLTRTVNGRRLFQIRGPKIVTRLSLVVEKDIALWGDGRLLIHGRGGRWQVVDLNQPRAQPAPR